jgi:hypothetical protein
VKLCCAVIIALYAITAWAQFDGPHRSDSLRADSLTVWPDTSFSLADSTLARQHATLRHGWLYPLGIMMLTTTGFIMLFTVRSR